MWCIKINYGKTAEGETINSSSSWGNSMARRRRPDAVHVELVLNVQVVEMIDVELTITVLVLKRPNGDQNRP